MLVRSIQIWLYRDDLTSQKDLIAKLPPTQKQRASQLKNKRQREFVIGRSLLTLAIKQNSRSDNWSITERIDASPIIEHASKQFIANISHSKGWVALAFSLDHQNSQAILGLDIEVLNVRQQFAGAKYFCNSAQLLELNAAPTNKDKSRYFTQLWTQKEAYVKAHQQSIWNSRLKSISFVENESENRQKHEFMHSAFLNESLVLSMFCNTTSEIDTRLIHKIDPCELASIMPLKLNWQSYRVDDEDQE